MEKITRSRYGAIIREKGRYFYTYKNQHTGASSIAEIVFNDKGAGETKTDSGGITVFKKIEIDILFELEKF